MFITLSLPVFTVIICAVSFMSCVLIAVVCLLFLSVIIAYVLFSIEFTIICMSIVAVWAELFGLVVAVSILFSFEWSVCSVQCIIWVVVSCGIWVCINCVQQFQSLLLQVSLHIVLIRLAVVCSWCICLNVIIGSISVCVSCIISRACVRFSMV